MAWIPLSAVQMRTRGLAEAWAEPWYRWEDFEGKDVDENQIRVRGKQRRFLLKGRIHRQKRRGDFAAAMAGRFSKCPPRNMQLPVFRLFSSWPSLGRETGPAETRQGCQGRPPRSWAKRFQLGTNCRRLQPDQGSRPLAWILGIFLPGTGKSLQASTGMFSTPSPLCWAKRGETSAHCTANDRSRRR